MSDNAALNINTLMTVLKNSGKRYDLEKIQKAFEYAAPYA